MVTLQIGVNVKDKNTKAPLTGVNLAVSYIIDGTKDHPGYPTGSGSRVWLYSKTDASGNASVGDTDAMAGTTCVVDVYLAGFTDSWEKMNSPYVAHYDVELAAPAPPPPPPTPTKGTLTVDTVPVKGTVYVEGTLWGTAPQSKLVDPGTYIVTFGAVTGYLTPGSQSVAVVAGQTTQVLGTYTLPGGGQPPPGPTKGILSVDTSPLKGKVFVASAGLRYQPKVKGSLTGGGTPTTGMLRLFYGFYDADGNPLAENQIPVEGARPYTFLRSSDGARRYAAGIPGWDTGVVVPPNRVIYLFDLPPDTYTIEWGSLSGWKTPSQVKVIIAVETDQSLEGKYLSTGVPPPPPPTGTPEDWGLAPQSREVDAGTYIVTFGSIPTYNTPAPQTAIVVAGQTKTVMGLYTPATTEKKKVAGDVFCDVVSIVPPVATPIPGAKVTLVGPDTLTFTTDSNGCWPAKGQFTEVYKVVYAYTVEASGFKTVSWTVDWSTVDFLETEMLRVPAGTGNFSGYVKDKDSGLGLKGAQIAVDSGQVLGSGDNGVYNTDTLLVGSISAGQHTVTVSLSGYDTLTDTVNVVAGQNVRKDFLLTKTAAPPPTKASVTGKVLDLLRNSRAIPGVLVTLWEGTARYTFYSHILATTYSDANGNYLFKDVIETTITGDRWLEGSYSDSYGKYNDPCGGSDPGTRARLVPNMAPGETATIDIGLYPPACSLEGLVWVDRSNDIWGGTISGKYPVPDATIRLDPLEPDLGTYSTTPDWMGRYEFGPGSTILSGKYTLSAWAPLYKQSKEEWVAPINTPVVKDIQLFLDYGSISGKITDSDTGAGVGDVAIWTNGPLKVGETNADGSYLLENVRPGTWNLWFKKGSYQDVYKSVKVETGKNTTVSFAMTYTGAPRPPPPPSPPVSGKCTIYGRVTDIETGQGLSNAYLTIIEGYMRSADAQGYYRFENIATPPYLSYRIQATKDGYDAKLETIVISSGESKEVNFQLVKKPGTPPPPGPPNTGSIHGTVSDTSGPVGSAGVSLQGVENVSTSSGSAGNYSLGPVQAGTYTLKVWKSGYDTFTDSVVIVAGQDMIKDVVLNKTVPPTPPPTPPTGSGTLYGYVRDNASAPVSGANLIFSSTSLASSGATGATTDKNGYYTITLSEGTYKVEITAPKCITVREDVAVVSDQVAEKDFIMELTNATPTPSVPSWLGPALVLGVGGLLILLGGL